jgi:FeS assembly protein IscX
MLTWEDTNELASLLGKKHPAEDLDNISLAMLYQETGTLSDFSDFPHLSNNETLIEIFVKGMRRFHLYE